MKKLTDIEGTVFTSNRFGDFVVTRYENSKSVSIKFIDTGYETETLLSHVREGKVQDNFSKTCYGVGYIGNTKTSKGGNHKESYSLWKDMLKRCYNLQYQNKRVSYKDCRVSDTFLSYEKFEDWCGKQVGFGKDGFRLDKDILIKGNKVYSPETCCFVPVELNGVLVNKSRARGDYPVGVSLNKSTGKFKARVSYSCHGKHLGVYDTPEEAFFVYKQAKEEYIKSLANKWKDQIDPRVYEALLNYEVEITD